MRQLIYRLGNNPRRSWYQFLLGLGLFVIGLVLVFAGAHGQAWWQIPGLLLLAAGALVAARGYVGIFANRFAQVLNRSKSATFEDN